jgi:hypothetical protein
MGWYNLPGIYQVHVWYCRGQVVAPGRARREPEKTAKKVEKVTQSLYFTNVPLEAGWTYRHETPG